MSKYLLKLFIAGKTAKSEKCIANLRVIGEMALSDGYELEVIDVLERPQQAEDEKILATPTLIKHSPPPIQRIVGDLFDSERVMISLGLKGAKA